jgi:hypothetical protein
MHNIATGLGWFSLALGSAQLLLPDIMNRQVAANATEDNRRIMRAIGLREILTGTGILLGRRRSRVGSVRAGWLWARFAGDVIDLALLGQVIAAKGPKVRPIASATNVAGIAALDLVTASSLSRRR